MPRTRTTLARLALVVFAASALYMTTAGSASAGWFVEGSELTGTSSLATTAAVDEAFKLEVPSAATGVKCTGSRLTSTNPEIVAPSRIAVASITFSSCTTEGAGGCTLSSETIGTVPLLAELAELTYPEDKASFTPKTKKTFATLTLTGEKCALLGTQPVTTPTKFLATLPTGQEVQATQQIKVKTTKGEIKLGGDEAELTGAALIGLVSGAALNFINDTPNFHLTTEKTGKEGKFLITSQAAKVRIDIIKAFGLTNQFSWNGSDVTACEKKYENNNESCGWKVKYTGAIKPSTMGFLIHDAAGGDREEVVTEL